MANDIGGVWRTIGGRRIFIKDGQDLASAMKESGKFNSTSQSKAKKEDGVLEEFKKSDGNTESFKQALNKISEMEYNNEIDPDKYKEYISKIQKEYADKKKGEKTNIKSDDKNLLSQIEQETDSYAYKELLDEYNAGKLTSADLEDTLKNLKRFNGDTDDLMTAEQLKGKNREEQKEINKQYLKEQNKLAQEKNDANFAKEWYEGTKKTENMAKENLERAKRNGASVEDLSNRTRQVHELELETQKAQEHANKMSKAVSDYENGAIDREEMLKRFGGNEERMKETFEKMGYTAPTKENIDKANANARMNANIRNAYQEYKKKHPGSKINFSKFKNNYKS